MSDSVNHPSHYNQGEVETIDGIRAALGEGFADYCRGNVLKYVWRCGKKGDAIEDLRKAAKYLQWAIEAMEAEKKPESLAIPDGWRELEENEPLCEDDLFDFEGEWVGHEYDPAGGVYSSRIHRRHIRKIEHAEPEELAIPDGWRELHEGEKRLKTDLYGFEGKWCPYIDFDPAGSDMEVYHKGIHYKHIRKIETANTSETPNTSIPDPGPGYRLLSKDPPERVIKGDEFWGLHGPWQESDNWRTNGVQCSAYYRRKIEPVEWVPKVGDKVRVIKPKMMATGHIGTISRFGEGTYSVRVESQKLTSFGLEAKDLELIEAAQ